MNNQTGFIFAFALDGLGGGRELNLNETKIRDASKTPIWIHLDYREKNAKEWLSNHSKIDPVILDVLTADETRPRSLVHNDGMLIILRGVNLNPNTDP